MAQDETLLADFPEEASAQAMAGLLQSENVPARVQASTLVPGLSSFRVLVPSASLHRARRVIEQSTFSDAELDSLATRSAPEPD